MTDPMHQDRLRPTIWKTDLGVIVDIKLNMS